MLYRPRFLRERPVGAAGRLSPTGCRRSSGPSPSKDLRRRSSGMGESAQRGSTTPFRPGDRSRGADGSIRARAAYDEMLPEVPTPWTAASRTSRRTPEPRGALCVPLAQQLG